MGVVQTPLSPLRCAVLDLLREHGPGSATTLAERLGETRQKINYHVRELERRGFVELVEERPRRGCTERFVRAVATAVLVEPSVVGEPPPHDRYSHETLLASAARLVSTVAGTRPATTFTLEADIGFESPAELERFADALAALAAQFDTGPHRYHLLIAGHPDATQAP
jgi:predicted ArsR family transcriptional regulator